MFKSQKLDNKDVLVIEKAVKKGFYLYTEYIQQLNFRIHPQSLLSARVGNMQTANVLLSIRHNKYHF